MKKFKWPSTNFTPRKFLRLVKLNLCISTTKLEFELSSELTIRNQKPKNFSINMFDDKADSEHHLKPTENCAISNAIRRIVK